MKKVVISLLCLLLLPTVSSPAMQFLKLRSSHHPGFMRIVVEGPEAVISKALVYQKGSNIMVNFPDIDFSIKSEDVSAVYSKVDKHTIMFYPDEFRGLKVFTLKHPTRLVMDVYIKEVKERRAPVIPIPEEKDKAYSVKIRTVVIDPGHGGYEYGLIKDDYIEKNVVLDIAKKLNILINRGSSVSFLTRGSDRLLTQKEKINFTKSKEADIFISLHIGNHAHTLVYVPMITEQVPDDIKPYLGNRGQEEYLDETISLLNAMKEALVSDFGDDMVSVRPLPYSILSKIESAALMIELPSFDDAYYVEELKAEIANTLYKGLYFYEEIKEK